MKKLLAIILGCIICCSCTMPSVMDTVETPSNMIKWISSNNRAATSTFDYVTIEIYKVPCVDLGVSRVVKKKMETNLFY